MNTVGGIKEFMRGSMAVEKEEQEEKEEEEEEGVELYEGGGEVEGTGFTRQHGQVFVYLPDSPVTCPRASSCQVAGRMVKWLAAVTCS
ncbi:hypothetical protein E2C01_066540 [Portunus trituberculatus]|uniref:Uncharacterized protein n=1 Tax=Portunus trituberculatus TaxID=210409 RepID=A0A5B7HLT0_PORTR|nr:hypothetical protein [Portunus trituberculatus]